MNLALWIVAGLLAALSLFGGATKAFMPKAKLDELGAKSGGDGPSMQAPVSSEPSGPSRSWLRPA
ncbi:hypothetical protein [Nocardia pneumoniae]|uniref:hypothetical protein n=1 Tax=Nocardia pneumoniae TaxID=228601 RepID=UPI00030F7FFD|nr:hypothetical protein [Nocardia pneumoniae]